MASRDQLIKLGERIGALAKKFKDIHNSLVGENGTISKKDILQAFDGVAESLFDFQKTIPRGRPTVAPRNNVATPRTEKPIVTMLPKPLPPHPANASSYFRAPAKHVNSFIFDTEDTIANYA
jgi:hypothetical protein